MTPQHLQARGVPAASAAALPFFTTPAQRIALARERFFEEGVRPSGLVPEAVIQSWTRCVGAHRPPAERIDFEPVTKSRINYTLARNRSLLDAAGESLRQLEAALAGTTCKLILTDRQGVIVHATPSDLSDGSTMRLISRVGVDLTEETVGTTAPGVVAKTGQHCSVQGAEHYFSNVHRMYCTAAPIRDAAGALAAVLDISCEGQPFRFDAASLINVCAAGIENRLLVAQSSEHVLVHFHADSRLLGTPLEGIAAVDAHGAIVWVNAHGKGLIAARYEDAWPMTIETVFALGRPGLLAAAHQGQAFQQRLPSGLSLWMRVRRPAGDGLHGAVAIGRPISRSSVVAESITRPASTSPVTAAADASTLQLPAPAAKAVPLHQMTRDAIESTLTRHGGNVSRAARELGVSRGLLYRRLKQWRQPGA